jgi:hypothetical protein
MTKPYVATKSRSQGRGGWAVIFRHPLRLDTAGKPGRRVRRGLGTADDAQADVLVQQLNEILSNREVWEPMARCSLAARFDERVLDIFYDGVEASGHDPEALRNDLLPLPGVDADYRSVLLLGTTGAGKTTLARQILGTDPKAERFPSTSTAKTTVADTELIFDPGDIFRAVVTFVGRDEVIDYLSECVSEAALAISRSAPEAEQRRRLLDHPDQRFRFSYILGRYSGSAIDDEEEEEDDDDDAQDGEPATDDPINLAETAEEINQALIALRELVAAHKEEAYSLATAEDDERVVEELMEETLDSALRGEERFHQIVDSLLDEIEKRFNLLTDGKLTKNRQGWPVTWTWETESRADLLHAVARFSSNSAARFGTLLTPLVNGIRVAGAFAPTWSEDAPPRLVLIDGEGLGHTPTSAAALSTAVSRRIETVDAVLLVDNAAQPMQAAPAAAMKAAVTSGNSSKLVVTFTHFDMVTGDNLPSVKDRKAHVMASLDSVLKAIGEDLGPFAERALRQCTDKCYFVGGIDRQLTTEKAANRNTIAQLNQLLKSIDHIRDVPEATAIRPVYDRVNLVLAIREAAAAFQVRWSGLLGIASPPGYPKEHWTRIKALTRRLATPGMGDEYDTLKPVAELMQELGEQILRMVQQPVQWNGLEPDDDEKVVVFEMLVKEISVRIMGLCQRRVKADQLMSWREAYAESGKNSTFRRARIIADDIYERAAPIPSVTPSPDQNNFLHEVTEIVDEVARNNGVKLR